MLERIAVPLTYAIHHLHDISACDRLGLPVAQEPGPLPVVPAALRTGRCFLSRSRRQALYRGPSPGDRPCWSCTPADRWAEFRWMVGAIRERPALRRVVASQCGDRIRIRQRPQGSVQRPAWAGGAGHPPGGTATGGALSRGSGHHPGPVWTPGLCR